MSGWMTPGRLCVCVNDDWDDDAGLGLTWPAPTRVPMLNEVLTIREVITDHPLKDMIRGGIALTFIELGTDDCYAAVNFAHSTELDPIDPDNLEYGSEYDG